MSSSPYCAGLAGIVCEAEGNLVPRGRDPFGQRRGSVFPAHDKRDPWGRGWAEGRTWNVNIRNVVIKRKPANGSSPGEESKSLRSSLKEKLTVAKVRMPKDILLSVIFTALGDEKQN